MITLASDFGSAYPAAMRGVVLQHTDARIVDIAHDFPRQDVRSAAFWLREVLPWYPPAVHCAVVDPGVGTDRNAIAVRVGIHAIVAPDNGLALPAARRIRDRADDDPELEVFVVEYENPTSATFHGRDVFAPAAARIHESGVDRIDALENTRPADDYVDLRLPDPKPFDGGIEGEILVVDGFGNAITNVPGDVVEGHDTAYIDGHPVPVGRSFAAVPAGDPLVTVGSHGNVELAVNQGRGDDAFDVAVGDSIRIEFA